MKTEKEVKEDKEEKELRKETRRIPVKETIAELDELFARGEMAKAGELLERRQAEAQMLGDRAGEITVQSELMGYYRKTGMREKGMSSIKRGLSLVTAEDLDGEISGATVKLNAATTLKAFGMAKEALPLYDEVFKVYREKLKGKDSRLAGLCNNAALAYADCGNFEKAEELFGEALEILSGRVEGYLDSAVTYVNMAHMYEARASAGAPLPESDKNTSEISDCMGRALLLLCDPALEENGYMAFVYSKCAPSFAHFGDCDSAAYLSKISEEIYIRNRESAKMKNC